MGRIRTLKPEFWEDEVIGTLSREARLSFLGSLNLSDDEGLLRWTPEYIKSNIFMYDDDITVAQTLSYMKELVEAGLIFPYRGGKAQQQLAFLINFRKHQVINRPQPSKLPAPSVQSSEVRYMYGKRDKFVCQLCHAPIPESPTANDTLNLSIDHIKAQAEGGSDYPTNIQATHQGCNKGRKAKPITDFVTPASITGALNSSANHSVNSSVNHSVSRVAESVLTCNINNLATANSVNHSVNSSVNHSVNNSLPEGKGREGKGRERKGMGCVGPNQPPNAPSPKATTPNPGNPDVASLVQRIVIAHPRSLMRKTRWSEATHAQATAVLKAMEDEMAASGCSPVVALEMILAQVERQAREVPPDRYQFFKDVEPYFALHEYRMEPGYFNREDRTNGENQPNQPQRVSAATERQRESHDAIAAAVQRRRAAGARATDGGVTGVQAEPDAATRDAGYVPPGVGGDFSGVRHGPVRARAVEGAAQVCVLPSA